MLIKEALYRHTAIPAAVKSLDASMLRNKAISANMANLMTPGYERIEVDFESKLKKEMERMNTSGGKTEWNSETARSALETTNPVAYRPLDLTQPGGINNVDLDQEAAKMAENQILYQYSIKFIQGEKELIDSAISGSVGA